MYFQDMVLKLYSYWGEKGCTIMEPYDIEVGAGTMSPHTFLRALGPEPWKIIYIERRVGKECRSRWSPYH